MSNQYILNIKSTDDNTRDAATLVFEDTNEKLEEKYVACRIPLCMFKDLTAAFDLWATRKKLDG